jgi:CRP-like cAMP-binding protein
VRFDRAAGLYRQGDPATEVLFLLAGSVRVAGGDPAPALVTAPGALNFADMLEGRPLRYGVEAVEPVVGLTLEASDFLTMLSDNILTAQGLFRMLLVSPGVFDRATLRAPTRTQAGLETSPDLDAIEIARRLRQIPIFSRATVDQLRDLVAATETVRLGTGDALLGGDGRPSMFYILEGQLELTTDGGSVERCGPGSTVGLVETLTGEAPGRRVVVTSRGHALALGHDALFDVLADHCDLLQGVFGGVLGVSAVDLRTGGLAENRGDR